jgi:hypothetical protein
MKSHATKLGVCVVVGLVGFSFIMARVSIEQIIIGFVLVALAVVFGSYFSAQLRQPKNPMPPEIEELVRRAQDKNGK